MRDIKFRGKRSKDGKWIYGDLFSAERSKGDDRRGIYYYADDDFYDEEEAGSGWMYDYVDPDTVGQYTGLKDPNGVEIYEGDIVYNAQLEFAEVKYENGAFWIYSPVQNICTRVSNQDCVNGNKYDNPELLTDKPWKQ